MHLHEIIWKDQFIDKIEHKHQVTAAEVEQVLFSKSHFRRAHKGQVKGEDLYVAYGQTWAGRLLVVFFIRKRQTAALPISARQMTPTERRYYEQHQ
jgi:hypothetical protein